MLGNIYIHFCYLHRRESIVSLNSKYPRMPVTSTSLEQVSNSKSTHVSIIIRTEGCDHSFMACPFERNRSKKPLLQRKITWSAHSRYWKKGMNCYLVFQDDTYKMYLQALADPRTGIPCQVIENGFLKL